MALAIIIFMILAIVIGCSMGDWDIAMYGVIPMSIGLVFGIINKWQGSKVDEMLKNVPEKAKRVQEILKGKRR